MRNKFFIYFKLFYGIKDKHESEILALKEIQSLIGKKVKPIYNWFDVLSIKPLNNFVNNSIRIQDYITHESCYGRVKGYFTSLPKILDISHLVKRLGYTQEIFLVVKNHNSIPLIKEIFPDGEINRNVFIIKNEDHILIRIITNQYFLEKSFYITKLSRNEDEIEKNIDYLINNLNNIYRIPASSSTRIGKRLEDYLATREEPSLYLNHYMHPYKGKFHPKMVRALLNYIYPNNKGLVMDNFAGSGTLLLEASLLGLDSVGIEINPLSVLMSNVKCNTLFIDINKIESSIEKYINRVNKEICKFGESGYQKSLFSASQELNLQIIKEFESTIPEKIKQGFKNDKSNIITQILIAKEVIKEFRDEKIKDFLLLGLSGCISDMFRRTKLDLLEVLSKRLNTLYLRLFLFSELNKILKINIGKSKTFILDARNFTEDKRNIKKDSIDAIVNSPPYSTALDYIKNDEPQLEILNLYETNRNNLEENIIGNPRIITNKKELLQEIENENGQWDIITKYGKYIILKIKKANRLKAALRTYKFYIDMYFSLEEMHKVMRKGAKAAIIVGNNHYKLNEDFVECKNDKAIEEMSTDIGFKIKETINRELEKTSRGYIRYESIIILEK